VWKWILLLLVVLVGSCAGGGYYLKKSGKIDKWKEQFQPGGGKGVEVRFGTVAKGDLVRTVSAPGQVEPKRKVEISAQVSARIIAIPLRENELVKKDDVVVRLDARDLAASLDAAKAELRSREASLEAAKSDLLNSERELGRAKELYSSKDVSKQALDQSQNEFDRSFAQLRMAEQSIEIAKANIQRAEKDLDNTTIKAPFDGIIIKRNAEVGELVVVGTLNNPGSVIMEIADLTSMIVRTRIDESNVAPVKEGQGARIFLNAYPDETMTGKVTLVGLKRKVENDGTAYFETEVQIDLPKGRLLRSGLTANVDIEVETFRDVLRVPSQAVVDRSIDDLPKAVTEGNVIIDGTKKFIRVAFLRGENGKVRAVPVKTAASDLTHTIVSAGLNEGDTLVVGPFKSLLDLKHDQLVKEDTAKPANGAKTAPAITTASNEKPASESATKSKTSEVKHD
jgi:HlyD family secretion protein